jgi:hypothetical protein
VKRSAKKRRSLVSGTAKSVPARSNKSNQN